MLVKPDPVRVSELVTSATVASQYTTQLERRLSCSC